MAGVNMWLCRLSIQKFLFILVLLYLVISWLFYPDLLTLSTRVFERVRGSGGDFRDVPPASIKRAPTTPRVPAVFVRNHPVVFALSDDTDNVPLDDVVDVPPAYGKCDGVYESFTDVGPNVYVYSVYWDPRQ